MRKGSVIVEWCMFNNTWSITPALLLSSPDSYIAIMLDDMLAMQELCLARKGMTSTLQCPLSSGNIVDPTDQSMQQAEPTTWL